jgi:hypothetical protein
LPLQLHFGSAQAVSVVAGAQDCSRFESISQAGPGMQPGTLAQVSGVSWLQVITPLQNLLLPQPSGTTMVAAMRIRAALTMDICRLRRTPDPKCGVGDIE